MSLGSNGVDRVSSLRKFRCDFVAQTFALIALVQPVLHRVSCSNEILPNTPKHYETNQNMSLGSNVLNWVCSLQKILMHCMARTSALIAPFQPVLHRVSCSNNTLTNAPKYYETQQNWSLGSNGVDRVRSLRKIMMRLRGTNFSTSSAHFAPSFERQRNGPKCIQIVQYTPKQEFGVQWGGSVVFVVKKSDATSWHELLHQFGLFCSVFCNATERSQMQQNSMKRYETRVWGPMGWIGCVHCEKF